MEVKTLDRMQAEIRSIKDGTGEFEAVLSVPTVDRDGEVIDAKAFDPLPDYIPIDIDHGMSVTSTVGSGQPFYDGDVLMLRGSFASTPLGQEVRTLVVERHVRKMSVAFMAAQREEKDGTPHITSAELLNAAIVAIPSNREADILAAKALTERTEEKTGARNSSKDAERLQSIHDLSVANGAVCDAKHAPVPDTDLDSEVKTSTDTDPEDAPAVAGAVPLADVAVARARAIAAEAHLAL